eukprot:TRINITY_DN772_c0_g1_i1.p2 TRINITY_DN772_c0_g1~~TRINITY_DN772_c0_g1_i1.p2  ORF type:complete len:244 (+),score=27.36 TRINITY_DN772_c0_g1_i1:266-997(+)
MTKRDAPDDHHLLEWDTVKASDLTTLLELDPFFRTVVTYYLEKRGGHDAVPFEDVRTLIGALVEHDLGADVIWKLLMDPETSEFHGQQRFSTKRYRHVESASSSSTVSRKYDFEYNARQAAWNIFFHQPIGSDTMACGLRIDPDMRIILGRLRQEMIATVTAECDRVVTQDNVSTDGFHKVELAVDAASGTSPQSRVHWQSAKCPPKQSQLYERVFDDVLRHAAAERERVVARVDHGIVEEAD